MEGDNVAPRSDSEASGSAQQAPSRPVPSTSRHVIKRAIYGGVDESFEDKSSVALCPICFEMIEEPLMTACGHTYCKKCIWKSLERSNRCPKCNFVIQGQDQLYPNFLLNEIISKFKTNKRLKLNSDSFESSQLKKIVCDTSNKLDLHDVNWMLGVLSERKQQLEAESELSQTKLLKGFLDRIRDQKLEHLDYLNREISLIESDRELVKSSLEEKTRNCRALKGQETEETAEGYRSSSSSSASSLCTSHTSGDEKRDVEGFDTSKFKASMATRNKRMYTHFDDLVNCYLSLRGKNLQMEKESPVKNFPTEGLDEFRQTLSKFTKYSSLQPLATLNYSSDHFNGSSIVSSIEFDKDSEFLAIAGVTKKIKVYEYNSVLCDPVDIHFPCHEMLCSSKISCVSWSNYHKGYLASSDYEGTVTVWDVFKEEKLLVFQEHEKRCWCVDFNPVDTRLLASGSDDSRVRLWAINMEHSVACLEAKVNVCCVKFNPESRYHLAFGSADHCVHYYDLRNTKEALSIFRGHRKAVSYVKFLNKNEIVSASTDSQLKLWNIDNPHCLRSFKGHLNEKNFVGLATDGDYITCGSENNALYVYYKGLSEQLFSFKFTTIRSILEKDKKEDESNEFVSAVCWRQGSNIIVAANSQGNIKILKLV